MYSATCRFCPAVNVRACSTIEPDVIASTIDSGARWRSESRFGVLLSGIAAA
jgi:hypothetical protein